MIFLSHNYKDKTIVEPIALRLAEAYGMNNVFYDSWSIQPGDGIIDKMNEGLTKCKFFFFFVSSNSLDSQMVKMEWQNMLMHKSLNDQIHFVPVRLESCDIPVIMQQTLYIDIYTHGMEYALRQMFDLIEGKSTYQYSHAVSNLKAYAKVIDDVYFIECRAEFFYEPVASFLLLSNENLDNVDVNVVDEVVQMVYTTRKVTMKNGIEMNAIPVRVSHGIAKNFPLVLELTCKDEITINYIMHETAKGKYTEIPLISQI